MATRQVSVGRTVATARTSASGGGGSSTSGNAYGLLLAITHDIASAGGQARSASVARVVI